IPIARSRPRRRHHRTVVPPLFFTAHSGAARMKLAILSRNGKLYSTRRLVEAARKAGHRARVLDPLRRYMRIGTGGFAMRYTGRAIGGYGAVVPRIGASMTRYGCAGLRQFELMGSHSPNPAAA